MLQDKFDQYNAIQLTISPVTDILQISQLSAPLLNIFQSLYYYIDIVSACWSQWVWI